MPKLARTIIPRIKKSFAERGIVRSLLRSVVLPIHLFREHRDAKAASRAPEKSKFDALYGVETDGDVGLRTYLSDLKIPNPNWVYGNDYMGIEPERFFALFADLEIRCEDFVFVDLGSGKGRALLLASERPFKRIVGIEFSPELNEIAKMNIQRYKNPKQRCTTIESVCADCSFYQIPEEPCVLFLFDPCRGGVLAKTMENIRRSLAEHPREMYLLYAAPPPEGERLASEFLSLSRRDPIRNLSVYANVPRRVASASNRANSS